MKTTILLFIMLSTVIMSHATPSKYEEVMLKTIEALYASTTSEQYQEVINKFGRIANKESDKWEPLYYISYGYIMMAIKDEAAQEKDKYLDLALSNIKEGLKLAPQEDELIALEGFVHMIRVTVDPATRGQQYAGLSMETFQKALTIDPDNPRALYLMAQMELGTARFFGSDTSAICEKLKLSIEKFDEVNAENTLAPQWGRSHAVATLKECK